MNIIIPMAGLGSRFPRDKYLPKPLIDIHGKPMIIRAIESLGLEGRYHFVIRRDKDTDQVKDLLFELLKDFSYIEIVEPTQGPACSALLFEDSIDNDEELVVANCDQIMEWNSSMFLLNARCYDGCVVTYYNNTDKNSYIKLDKNGRGLQLEEKKVISTISLNGIHYWKKGSYFVESSKKMIEKNHRAPNGEFYISISYNYMINANQTVGIYHIPNEQHHAVGDPSDLEKYLKLKS